MVKFVPIPNWFVRDFSSVSQQMRIEKRRKTMTNKCPVCGCEEFSSFYVPCSYGGITMYKIGRIAPNVCLNCGTIYLDAHDLFELRRRIDAK